MRNGKSYSEAGKLGAIASLKTHQEQKQKRIAEYNQHPTKCKFCGIVLDYEHRNNKFCCHSCSASFNNKGVVRNGKVQKVTFCKCCGAKLIKKSQKKFCSIKCQQNYKWEQKK